MITEPQFDSLLGGRALAAAAGGRTARLWVCWGALLLVVSVSACSRQNKAVGDIRSAFERREYRETIAFSKHAIRRNIDRAEVYYYYGLALLALSRDFEAFKRLDEAVSRDSELRDDVSRRLRDGARDAWENGRRPKAARRMQKAVEIEPGLDIGPFAFAVADVYFEGKDFERAAAMYGRAIRLYPDSSTVERAYFRLARSRIETGSPGQARKALEEMLDRFPRGRRQSEAVWQLVNLQYDEGEKQYVLGNYERAIEILGGVVERADNAGLLQRAHFLLGESSEALGDYEAAYRQYREVIKIDRGASGSVVMRAREKIAGFKEAGLY